MRYPFSPVTHLVDRPLQWLRGGRNANSQFIDTMGDHDGTPQIGRYKHFDAATDYINCGSGTPFDIDGSTEQTWAMWINADDFPSTNRIISCGDFETDGWEVLLLSTTIILRTYTSGVSNQVAKSHSLTAPTGWFHFAMTLDSGTAEFFINGSSIGSGAFVTPVASSLNFYLGCYALNQGFNLDGSMMDVRRYGKVLSQTEIDCLVDKNCDVSNSDLLDRWPLEENSGAVIYNTASSRHGSLPASPSAGFFEEAQTAPFSSANEFGWSFGVNLLYESEHDSNASGKGTVPPTVNNADSYLGEDCVSATFPAGVSGYSASRIDSSGGNKFPVIAGEKYIWQIDIAFSRLLTGSENIRVYFTGTFALQSVYINSSHAANATNWSTIESSVTTVASTGTDFFASFVESALSTPVTVYYTKRQVEKSSVLSGRYEKTIGSPTEGAIIPLKAGSNLDIFDNTPTYLGRVRYPALPKNSNCIKLDGLDDYIETNETTATTGKMEALIIYDSADNSAVGAVFGKSGTNLQMYVAIDNATNEILYKQGADAVNMYTGAYVTDGQAHVIGMEWNGVGNDGYIYLDGDVIETFTQSGDDQGTDGRLLAVGARRTGTTTLANHINAKIIWYKEYEGTTLNQHLVFSNGSGVAVYDISDNGNHGELINGPTWSTQDDFHYNLENGCSKPLLFNDTDVYIQTDSHLQGSTNFEVSFMINRSALGTAVEGIYDSRSASTLGVIIFTQTGTIKARLNDSANQIEGTTVLNANQWYHVKVTYDGANFKLFIDGVEEDDLAITEAVGASLPAVIGAKDPYGTINAFLDSQICNFRVVNNGACTLNLPFLEDNGASQVNQCDGSIQTINGTLTNIWNTPLLPTNFHPQAIVDQPNNGSHNGCETELQYNPYDAPRLPYDSTEISKPQDLVESDKIFVDDSTPEQTRNIVAFEEDLTGADLSHMEQYTNE